MAKDEAPLPRLWRGRRRVRLKKLRHENNTKTGRAGDVSCLHCNILYFRRRLVVVFDYDDWSRYKLLGYLGGNKTGAIVYNVFHHKGVAILIVIIALILKLVLIFFDPDVFVILGTALFGHSSMDRFFGYGLKYENGFKFTHLGEIGKK
jgi:hypothetical protein